MPGATVTATNLTVDYGTAADPLRVLDDVTLTVTAGERIAITGPSGAGKTTLLALIGGLEPVRAGRVLVDEVDLAGLSGDDLARYRHLTVGFVFQHFGLLGTLTALENVELAMSFGGIDRRTRRLRATELLASVGIAARADHRPAALSGGEAQRVALARALANRPALLLADEPTGNLDHDTAARMLDLIDEVAADHGATLVTVTHDPAVAARADRVVRLRDGRVVAA